LFCIASANVDYLYKLCKLKLYKINNIF
jgi:hypothetical protein